MGQWSHVPNDHVYLVYIRSFNNIFGHRSTPTYFVVGYMDFCGGSKEWMKLCMAIWSNSNSINVKATEKLPL